MRLRPHHLLCTQGYSGKGYSDDFVENMTDITNRLRSEPGVAIRIVFSTDDICAKCPQMLGEDHCQDNSKVKIIDKKLVDYFGLEEKEYNYQDVVAEINAKMTEAMMNDICYDCSWYPVSACKSRILGVTNDLGCGISG